MARIETIFAKDVGGTAIPPILIRSRQLAWYEEEITWRCYNEHPRVKWVKIWFEDASADYFSGNGARQTWYKKQLTRPPLPTRTRIWGRTPVYSSARPKDKYTVAGYASEPQDGPGGPKEDPQPITSVDPEIDPIQP